VARPSPIAGSGAGATAAISERIWGVLACPHCRGELQHAPGGSGARCGECGLDFAPTASGQLDLRLRRPQARQLEIVLPEPSNADATRDANAAASEWGRLRPRPAPEVEVGRVHGECHLPADLRSWFPRAAAAAPAANGRELALDLGCGAQVHREVCELAGYEYVGLDYATPEAMILGDAQSLPFRDGSFGFVLTIAVLEHVQFPLLMMREAQRVLRPGGRLVGTVAFLEPFHQNSYHHHTHLGTLHALRFAGFQVEHVAPSGGWSGLEAQANMGLFPNSPRWLARLLVAPLLALHRLWWRAGRLLDPDATEARRMIKNSGAILFLASKP
jgi:SAM-dependent methyltransferase